MFNNNCIPCYSELKLKYLCFLKVRWDETSAIPRPDRVSPWKIEPALAPPALNSLPVSRPKRPRSNMVPSSPDSSVLNRDGSLSLLSLPLPHLPTRISAFNSFFFACWM